MPVFLFCSPRKSAPVPDPGDVDVDVDLDVDLARRRRRQRQRGREREEQNRNKAYSVEDTTRDGREIPCISIGYIWY